ncbi:MAG: glycosyltransferase family 4 protein [Candidatus Dojkabacteria bacterium]|nr:MAG: glycosyltransferase family 4 protein [Candidatus Dojkabacteria bacterium]
MKDLLIICGRLSSQDRERYLASLSDRLSAADLAYDVIQSSDLRVGLLNYYHGFVFVNIGSSDRVSRFVSKGRIFNKTFFQMGGKFTKGGTKNTILLADLVDITFAYKMDSLEFIPKTRIRFIDEAYSEGFLSQFNHYKKPEERQGYLVISKDSEVSAEYITNLIAPLRREPIYFTGGINGRLPKYVIRVKSLENLLRVVKDVRAAIWIGEDQDTVTFDRDIIALSMTPIVKIGQSGDDASKAVDRLQTDAGLLRDLHESRYKCFHSKGAVYKGRQIREIVLDSIKPSVGFNIPGSVIRGGVNVAMHHAKFLLDAGFDVTLISDTITDNEQNVHVDHREIPLVATDKSMIQCRFDILVATLWNTTRFVSPYSRALKKYYLVQGYETDFLPYGDIYKTEANKTYFDDNINYITISKWCQDWLTKDYGRKKVGYAPNGLDIELFDVTTRPELAGRKLKIIIEGNCEEPFRGIDEAFEIVQGLDRNQFEIHYLSYTKSMKDWYDPDFSYFTVPYYEVSKIYSSCDIMLKCSTLESFSYPPLEMMATGGLCVIASNEGNKVYAAHEENSLVYESGEKELAREYILKLQSDAGLREKLIKGGVETAKKFSWENVKPQILDLYK